MNLEEALKATRNHPPAPERIDILKDQITRFRREFYGHMTDLQRIAAYEAAGNELPSDLAEARQRAESSLDSIHGAIEATLEELQKLDSDAR